MNSCLLCKKNNTRIIEKVDVNILKTIYEERAISMNKYFNGQDLYLRECNSCKLIYYDPAPIGDGEFYAQLQENIKGYYLKEKEDYVIAAAFIQPTDNVLEIGCGEGFFTNYLKGNNYTGLEYNESAIIEAQNKGLNVIKKDIDSFAENNAEAFDLVCYYQVLEHVEKPHEFIKSSLKCLKKGGKLIFAVPSEDTFLKYGVNLFLNAPPHHVTRWQDVVFKNIEGIFDLKLLSLKHEKLHSLHKVFYLQCRIQQTLSGFLGIKYQNFTAVESSNYRLFKFSYLLSKLFSPIYFLFKQNAIGQSIIAVYEK
jgi:2-polyprenyl-3-methyl-5-hydroxy-6-metoxy-1,4-benzoquinol methylase